MKKQKIVAALFTVESLLLVLSLIVVVLLAVKVNAQEQENIILIDNAPVTTVSETTATTETKPTVTEPTATKPTAIKTNYYYPLSEFEKDIVERVVMAEAGGEPVEGQMAVAQCILNGCLKLGREPSYVVDAYSYTHSRPDPTDEVKESVSRVFDEGEVVTNEKILYFYAPERCTSSFHESMKFAIEINGHRFFADWD